MLKKNYFSNFQILLWGFCSFKIKFIFVRLLFDCQDFLICLNILFFSVAQISNMRDLNTAGTPQNRLEVLPWAKYSHSQFIYFLYKQSLVRISKSKHFIFQQIILSQRKFSHVNTFLKIVFTANTLNSRFWGGTWMYFFK